jgi:hypothetical protein
VGRGLTVNIDAVIPHVLPQPGEQIGGVYGRHVVGVEEGIASGKTQTRARYIRTRGDEDVREPELEAMAHKEMSPRLHPVKEGRVG